MGQNWLQSPTYLTISHKMKRSRHSESGHGSLRSIWVQLMTATWRTWRKFVTSQMGNLTWTWRLMQRRQKTRCIKLYSCGRPNGFDAWRSLSKALKPTSKARDLALLRAVATWPAFSMNSALQPQLLKSEDVFDETVKAGTKIQEELKSAILLRCVGGQLKSYLNLTTGDNVQYSTLREHVLQ